MKNINYTKEEINAAIYDVLTHMFKKDCPEAHEIVKAAGYTLSRDNGYEVSNEETGRTIYVTDREYYGKIHFNWFHRPARLTNKFDFVGCLDKPINKKIIAEYNPNTAIEKYRRLKSKKWDIEYHEERIKRIKNQMMDLQKQLIHETEMMAKSKVELKEFKQNLGLSA